MRPDAFEGPSAGLQHHILEVEFRDVVYELIWFGVVLYEGAVIA